METASQNLAVRMGYPSQGKKLHEASSNSLSCPWEISFAIWRADTWFSSAPPLLLSLLISRSSSRLDPWASAAHSLLGSSLKLRKMEIRVWSPCFHMVRWTSTMHFNAGEIFCAFWETRVDIFGTQAQRWPLSQNHLILDPRCWLVHLWSLLIPKLLGDWHYCSCFIDEEI